MPSFFGLPGLPLLPKNQFNPKCGVPCAVLRLQGAEQGHAGLGGSGHELWGALRLRLRRRAGLGRKLRWKTLRGAKSSFSDLCHVWELL